ncbi:hypothetical protein [Psychrobacillus sp. OK032]|uniref:hypothetical protein n=1 Tax=Psychrobacillus sp. OK032 TaxID=1884358 RepID=UPI0008B68B76|nr:hypothetical protein [Psychrobacillus sp. OK032]SER66533.1 hypothetical protein SAMN05518872_101551 [Psychrobacillus sp. OK032]
MYSNPIDPEEMAMRKNWDVIASLNMIGEGGPVYNLEEDKEDKQNTLENNNH